MNYIKSELKSLDKLETKEEKMENNQPQQTPPQQPAQTSQPPQPKKGTNVALIIIIVVVVLLILGAGAGYYVYYRAKQAVQKATESIPATTTPGETTEETLPSSDVAGSDITGISRYPGSVRTEYYKDAQGTFTNITYKAKASSDDILDFYKKLLPEKSWELTYSEEDSISFTKDPASSQLTISITTEGKTITEYELSYFPGLAD